MDYKINATGSDWEILSFTYDNRTWEIEIDFGLSDYDKNLLVLKRIDELTDEFLQYKTYDYSDLLRDYKIKKDDNLWQ